MSRKQFTFYRSYYEAVKVLPKKEQVAVMLAVCAYALDDEEPKLTGTAGAIFSLIRPTLDASRRKSENGKQGGSKTQAKRKQTVSKKENEVENEVEVEVEGENENECSLPPTPLSGEAAEPRPSRFTPPSVDEVSVYCQERRNGIDPQAFVDFYTSKGWMVGKNKMKDWRAAVRNWERKEEHRGTGENRRDDQPKVRYGTHW